MPTTATRGTSAAWAGVNGTHSGAVMNARPSMMSLCEGAKTIALTMLLLFPVVGAAAGPDTEALLRRGQLREALVSAAADARTRPDDVAAQELYIDMLLTIGLAPRALREFTEVVRLDPTNPDSQYLLGRATIDPRAAQRAYEAALKQQPEHARSHMGVAAVHLALGRIDAATAGYKRAIDLDSSLSEAWLGLVRVQVSQGHPDAALVTARAGMERVPDEAGLPLTIALLDSGAALETLTAAVARTPDDGRLHEALAEAQLAAGDSPAALASSEAALTIDPTLQHAQLARLYARELTTGRLDVSGYLAVVETHALLGEAKLRSWNRLAKAHPTSSLVLLGRGETRQRSDDMVGARTDLVAAATLDPDNEEAAAAAGLALLASDPAAATPLLERARLARPWDASVGIALAEARRASGDVVGGIVLLREVAEAHVFHVEAHVYLAQALVDADRAEEAYEIVAAAVERFPDPRLAAAFVLVATEAGHFREAAAVLDQVVKQTGNPSLAQAANRLRELAATRE